MDINWQIVVNIAVGVSMPLLIWGLSYLTKLSSDLTALKVHVAESYVQKPEIAKIDKTMADIQASLSEILKTVHELKGRIGTP